MGTDSATLSDASRLALSQLRDPAWRRVGTLAGAALILGLIFGPMGWL